MGMIRNCLRIPLKEAKTRSTAARCEYFDIVQRFDSIPHTQTLSYSTQRIPPWYTCGSLWLARSCETQPLAWDTVRIYSCTWWPQTMYQRFPGQGIWNRTHRGWARDLSRYWGKGKCFWEFDRNLLLSKWFRSIWGCWQSADCPTLLSSLQLQSL